MHKEGNRHASGKSGKQAGGKISLKETNNLFKKCLTDLTCYDIVLTVVSNH